MKVFCLISILLVSIIATSCGDTSSEVESGRTLTQVEGASEPPLISVPDGPPPTQLIVNDLRAGIGAVARHGQRLRLQYVDADYRTGKEMETRWGTKTFSYIFGGGTGLQGWEIGLKGMKVGGLRELVLPSRLAYGNGPRVYVIELLSITR